MSASIAATLVVFGLILGGALAVPGAHGTPPTADRARTTATGAISVAATGSYSYVPDTLQNVPTNATITVTFTDDSTLSHTFTIIGRAGWVIPSSYTWQQIDSLGYGKSPPALFNANVSGPGTTNVSTFLSPGPGWYEFVCTVSGHFQNGMYGFIAFGESLPSNLTPPSARVGIGGATITPVQAAVGGLFAIAAIVAFVVWRRRRGPRPTTPPKPND